MKFMAWESSNSAVLGSLSLGTNERLGGLKDDSGIKHETDNLDVQLDNDGIH
jgi:hypothetical protein